MTAKYDIVFDEVTAAAEGNWGAVMSALAPALEPAVAANGKHVSCPVHGGKNSDAFRVFKDFDQTGGCICNSCGAQPNGIATLKWLFDWDTKQAFTEVANVLGMTDTAASQSNKVRIKPKAENPENEKAKAEKRAQVIGKLKAAWEESVSPVDEKGRILFTYLANRKLGIPAPTSALRVHPAYPYYHIDGEELKNLGEFPVIMSKFSDKNGNPLTIHRTYLSPDGQKADIPYSVKKFMASPPDVKATGGAIYLDPPAPRIAVCEGLETALAVRQATELNTVACCSATLLGKYEPNEVTQEVFIFADYDDSHAGQNAAMTLANRLLEKGIESFVFLPPRPGSEHETKGVDWLDAFASIGTQAFPHMALPAHSFQGRVYYNEQGEPTHFSAK